MLDAFFLIVLATVWLPIPIACAMALDAKGRSAVGGFFAGVFFPVGAVVYTLAAPSQPVKAYQPAPKTGPAFATNP
jgi:hypothetical protein